MKKALEHLERRVESEGATDASLRAFWRLITQAKMQKQISDDELERVIELRDRIFEERFPRFMSLSLGLTLSAISAIAGLFLVLYALQPVNILVFLAASLLLLVGTHPWGHWIAGKLVGVSFEYFYLDGPAKFEPCLKIDYRKYLRVSFDSRMMVHASGALATALTASTLLAMSFTVSSFEIRSLGALIFLIVAITEVVAFAGLASGDLKRVRRERRLKKLYFCKEKH